MAGAALLGNNSSYIYDEDSGEWINSEFQRIAQVINDFDPTLSLAWIPPKDRNGDAPPYALIHTPGDQPQYIVMTIKEDELNHNLIAKLFLMRRDSPNMLEVLEAQNAAVKALELKAQEETYLEWREKAEWMFSTKINYIRDGKGRVIS